MNSRTLGAIGVSAALFVTAAACTASPGQGNDATTDVAESAGVIVVPGAQGFDDDTLVVCGGAGPFPADALHEHTQLDAANIPEDRLAPIQDFLSTGEGEFWPQEGYWVLHADDQTLLLAHIDVSGSETLLGSALNGGSWVLDIAQSGGPCEVQVPLPEGLGEVAWRVDSSRPLDDQATSVTLLATGQACSSGSPMGSRLRPPAVLLSDDIIFVALTADLPQGAQTCPGNPEEPVVVELGQPIGDRDIVNARLAAGVLSDYLPVSPA